MTDIDSGLDHRGLNGLAKRCIELMREDTSGKPAEKLWELADGLSKYELTALCQVIASISAGQFVVLDIFTRRTSPDTDFWEEFWRKQMDEVTQLDVQDRRGES